MTYVLPCNRPDFRQSAPRGEGWRRDGGDGPQVTWRNESTGESAVCPAIWYNLPAGSYAKALRFNADRSDECAAHQEAQGKPWSAGDADRYRQQARRLRAMAMLCDRAPDVPAGSIDFRGLSNPSTPRDAEAATVAAIEEEESA